jgi:carboxyl-terminal processing protease
MNNTKEWRFSLPVALAAAFLVGISVGRLQLGADNRPVERRSSQDGGSLPGSLRADHVREVWDALHEKFAGTLDDTDLATGALKGIAAGTGDPYTAYADPEESKQFAADLSGSFTGIGVEIGLRRGLVTVIAPLRGSPAERAGLRAQDVIGRVDGEEVFKHLTLTEVVTKIRGPAGTEVRLSVAREGHEGDLNLTIRRERIAIESVTLTIQGQMAIVTLNGFNDATEQRFQRVAREILRADVQGVVLDLRNNPGGLLEQAVKISGHFLPRNALVVSEVPKDPAQRTDHRTDGPGDLARLPVVVLVNGGSASAAARISAALQEQRNAPLVGETTFGKGSVQELLDFPDGSSLHVTVARWHTPKDQEIGDEGIAPTVPVEDKHPTENPDEILEKGLEVLRQQTAADGE